MRPNYSTCTVGVTKARAGCIRHCQQSDKQQARNRSALNHKWILAPGYQMRNGLQGLTRLGVLLVILKVTVLGRPAFWHVRFHQTDLPEKLVSGRQAEYFQYFLSKFSDSDVAHYAHAYRDPDYLRAAFETFVLFQQARSFSPHSATARTCRSSLARANMMRSRLSCHALSRDASTRVREPQSRDDQRCRTLRCRREARGSSRTHRTLWPPSRTS